MIATRAIQNISQYPQGVKDFFSVLKYTSAEYLLYCI